MSLPYHIQYPDYGVRMKVISKMALYWCSHDSGLSLIPI